MTLWVLVANSSFAEIFSINHSPKKMKREHYLDFPKGREKSGDILSDRPGRTFESMGNSRHAVGKKVDVHSHEQQVFAHQLVDLLRKSSSEQLFDQLILIAPPKFLGELRAILPEFLKQQVSKEINKDLPASLSERERMEHVDRLLALT
jgi:protein required for attachment to host cells